MLNTKIIKGNLQAVSHATYGSPIHQGSNTFHHLRNGPFVYETVKTRRELSTQIHCANSI